MPAGGHLLPSSGEAVSWLADVRSVCARISGFVCRRRPESQSECTADERALAECPVCCMSLQLSAATIAPAHTGVAGSRVQ